MSTSFICCDFSSGLDDMKRKDQGDVVKVLRVLAQCGRYSVFEATANMTIARMMTRLHHKGCTMVDRDGTRHEYGKLINILGGNYPWTHIELKDGGKLALFEIKDGAKVKSAQKKTSAQEKFFAEWAGYPICLVDGPEAALRMLAVMK